MLSLLVFEQRLKMNINRMTVINTRMPSATQILISNVELKIKNRRKKTLIFNLNALVGIEFERKKIILLLFYIFIFTYLNEIL
jgi:hypothetical protein